VAVLGVAGQYAPDFFRLGIPGEDGDPIPALLPVPDDSVTCVSNGGLWKILLRGL